MTPTGPIQVSSYLWSGQSLKYVGGGQLNSNLTCLSFPSPILFFCPLFSGNLCTFLTAAAKRVGLGFLVFV